MKFSEEQIRDIVAIKEDIIVQIEKHQKRIDLLERNLGILDHALKDSSFTKASQLGASRPAQGVAARPPPRQAASHSSAAAPDQEAGQDTGQDTGQDGAIPIKQGGRIIANALVTAEQIAITPADGISVSPETPPFKSFFLDRIIAGMQKKDAEEAGEGRIQQESIIGCTVTNDGESIGQITITNYRDKERVDELVNTAGWTLSKMLEKVR